MNDSNKKKALSVKQQIILFDGVCNLCDKFVQFVLRHDHKELFVFASLQSDIGQKLLKKYDLDNSLRTVVLIFNDKAYTHSDVALKVGHSLGGWLKIAYLGYLIPKFIRDILYNWIAVNRYRIFGKQDQCMMPKKEWKNRFLDERSVAKQKRFGESF